MLQPKSSFVSHSISRVSPSSAETQLALLWFLASDTAQEKETESESNVRIIKHTSRPFKKSTNPTADWLKCSTCNMEVMGYGYGLWL